MDSNKMTGEPNQQNPTSVFGFDTYPQSFAVNWNQTNPFGNVSQYSGPISSQHELFRQSSELAFHSPDMAPLSTLIPNPTLNPMILPNNYSFDPQSSGFCFGAPKLRNEMVHFPFENVNSGLRCKRKTDSPPLQAAKQHITEEKMAEHMSKLHISSETAVSKETDSTRMQRLYMCEEMRKLQTDSILPQSLLSRIQHPCTALVLWKPPTRLVPIVDSNIEEQGSKNKNSDINKMEDAVNEAEMGDVPLNDMDLDTC